MEGEKIENQWISWNKITKYPDWYEKKYPEDCKDEMQECISNTKEKCSELEQECRLNPKDLIFSYDGKKWPGEKIKKKLDTFLGSDLDLFDLPALWEYWKQQNIWYLLSAIYSIWWEYIEKFKDKMAKNPKSLKYISDNWEKWLKIDTKLQVSAKESSKLKKAIIDKCIEWAKKWIDLKINSLLDKSNIKDKEKREKLKKEILLSLDKAVKTWDNGDLSNLATILSALSDKSSDSLKMARELLWMKKVEIELSNISLLDKLKQEKPDFYELIVKLQDLQKLDTNNNQEKNKIFEKTQILTQEATNKATTLEEKELIKSISVSRKIDKTIDIYEKYSKNEETAKIFLQATKENKNISATTIDQAIKEQKIDLKTGKIDAKFLDEKWEIRTNFTKEQFYEIKADTSWFLKELPVWAELPVWETSNIQKNSDWTYDIKIVDKITWIDKFDTNYQKVDEAKAWEIIKYINLFDEIWLSYLSPQLLKSWDDTILKKLWISLDWKTSISWNVEERKLLQEISKMFFPEEQVRSDIYDLKLLFKQKLMNQWFMWIGFRWFAIDNYQKNKEKSIFDENWLINPLKITTSI